MQQLNLIRRKVVTLCGSTKFREQFHMANAQLTMAGYIVLSVGFFIHKESEHDRDCHLHPEKLARSFGLQPSNCRCARREITDAQKAALDVLHFDKIRMSDGIYVINVAGYIGASTMREVAFAVAAGKSIEWLEEVHGVAWLQRADVSHALGAQVAQFVEGLLPDLVTLPVVS